MFTGIIKNIAQIKKIELSEDQDLLLAINVNEKIDRNLEIGCSIANNGICLTLTKKQGNLLFFQASKETLQVTTLNSWKVDDLVNIEFSLRLGDELGGHYVSGHVDGVAQIKKMKQVKDSWKMQFSVKNTALMQFLAKKGSVCLNGISLTVNEVFDNSFEVNIIKHTFENTNLQNIKIDDEVNLEIDLLARYINRRQEYFNQ